MTTIIQANPHNDTLKWIFYIGLAGAVYWYLQATLLKNTVTAGGFSLLEWWNSLWQGDQAAPKVYDSHGCDLSIASWCQSLGHCVPTGLTCPNLDTKPWVPPVRAKDSQGCLVGLEQWCSVAGMCVNNTFWSEGLCEPDRSPPVVDYPVIQVNDMCYYQGMPVLNVPPGTDCSSAIAVMCQRFGKNSKWCGMV